MLFERSLQPGDQRTFHPDLDIAPMLGILGVAGPFLGETDAAGKSDLAVQNQYSPVGPPIGPVKPPGAGWMI